jgi:hypothetical protein
MVKKWKFVKEKDIRTEAKPSSSQYQVPSTKHPAPGIFSELNSIVEKNMH